jgi:MFS family permease
MLVAASMAIPMGIVSDRLGRRRLAIIGSIISALSSFFLAIANNPFLAIIINACAGLGSAAYSPAITAFVGDISTSSERGRIYGYYTTALQVAMAIGPGIGGGIVDVFHSYEAPFILSGFIIAIGSIIGLFFFPKGTSPVRTQSTRSRRDFLLLLRKKSLLTAWIATFSSSLIWSVASTYLPLYARTLGLIATEIGLLFTIQAAINAVGRVPSGLLYDRVTKHTTLLLASVLIGIGVIALISTTTSAILLFLLMGLFGFTWGMTTTTTTATIAATLSQSSRGIGMGAYYLFFYGGMAVGPALLGPVMSTFGFQHGFIISAGIGLAAISSHFTFRFMRNQSN